MSSITNVNNNSSVVNVGRTTPVSPGAQPATKSIPVVMATDQSPIPVIEQNKVQSEVALSLLGIPRAEVALGIFADVNTYDVNPSEWSTQPEYHIGSLTSADQGHGIKHLPTEAGALVEAPRDKVAVLTSKRFFRYQPGRVSAATFGVKSSVATQGTTVLTAVSYTPNPTIKKFGIYDNFDGYFWETRNNGQGDNFSVVRRSQSLLNFPNTLFAIGGTTAYRGKLDSNGTAQGAIVATTQIDDYRVIGKGKPEADEYSDVVAGLSGDRKILQEKRYTIVNAANVRLLANDSDFYTQLELAYTGAATDGQTAQTLEAKCKRDAQYWIDAFLLDMEWGGTAHTLINGTNYKTALLPNPSLYEKKFYMRLLNEFLGLGGTDYGFSSEGLVKLTTLIELLTGTGNKISDANDTDATGTAVTTQILTTLNQVDTDTDGSSGLFNNTQKANIHTAEIADNETNYGKRLKVDTIFDIKSRYWAYVVTTKAADGSVITYKPPALATGSGLSAVFTGEDLRYKCQRDVGYIIDGLRNDIAGGGDAETAYNMSMFHKANGMSLYSQVLGSGALSETERYAHLKTTMLYDLKNVTVSGVDLNTFGYTTSDPVYTKVNALLTSVEDNFEKEHETSPTLGKRGYAGNLVSMRDGLLITHAAVYDPSLLKDAEQIDVITEAPETIEYIAANDFAAGDIAVSASAVFTLATGHKLDLSDGDLIKVVNIGSTITGSAAASVVANTFYTVDDVVLTTANGTDTEGNLATTFTLKSTGGAARTVGGGANLGTSGFKIEIYRHRFKLSKGHVTYGQTIKFVSALDGSSDSWGIPKNTLCRVKRVYGPKGDVFSLETADPGYADGGARTRIEMVSTQVTNAGYFELVVPFIFPRDYDPVIYKALTYSSEITRTAAIQSSAGDTKIPDGPVFPYMYSTDDDLTSTAAKIGIINTSLDISSETDFNSFRTQIDDINFYPEYINWIKNNVKPEFYGVYDYRVPRSRFSHDPLNGIADTDTTNPPRNRVYSDLATAPDGTIARPGKNYATTIGGTTEKQNSEYAFDFTKVTMLKIEFSWYGAVGALFLAYVPVGNGEARWVRVHHLRASNQLKIASLGNATLPITYTTYGGGVSANGTNGTTSTAGTRTLTLGDGDVPADRGYSSSSHHIVKYGASYYIDGGDRGTVRLYSHNNDSSVSAYGRKFTGDGDWSNESTYLNLQAVTSAGASAKLVYPQLPTNNETLATIDLSKADITRMTGNTVLPNSTSTTFTTSNTAGQITASDAISLSDGDVVEISGTISASGGNANISNRGDGSAYDGTATKFKVDAIDTGSSPDAVTVFTLKDLAGNAIVTVNSKSLAGTTITRFELINPRFFMYAKVLTTNPVDQNVKVCWADDTKVYLSSEPLGTPTALVADRSANVFGLETKKVILSTKENNAVRNRVQVYPTKLSASNIATNSNPVRLRFRKTPKFQYNCETSGRFILSSGTYDDYTVTSANTALDVDIDSQSSIASVVNATNTITIADSSDFFRTGQPVKYVLSGNTAPNGLVSGTVYYYHRLTANTAKLYTTEANAIAGTSTGLVTFSTNGTSPTHVLIGIHGATNYIADGKYVYGWFRGKVANDKVTVFGELYRKGSSYYFTVLDNYSSTVKLIGGQEFLPDLNFNANGQRQPVTLVETSNYTEKEGLSSVNIAPKTIAPIPNTGINVATIYLQSGTEQIDLATYFDYNKEYLSYPLTNEADTLYFAVDSDTVATEADKDQISLGVTWEEQ